MPLPDFSSFANDLYLPGASASEFTHYLSLDSFKLLVDHKTRDELENRLQVDGLCKFLAEPSVRFHASRAFDGDYVSVTIRTPATGNAASATSSEQFEDQKSSKPEYPVPFRVVGDYLYSHIKSVGQRSERGLIVLSGTTAAGKSKVTQHLISRVLSDSSGSRKPHLVTFEDPIERYLFDFQFDPLRTSPNLGSLETFVGKGAYDYTPRTKGKDVLDLESFSDAALRQTPRVAYISETRRTTEWKQLLELSGTGHLVVTTAHAGGVVETLAKIFDAVDCMGDSSRRYFAASRISSIVHLLGAQVRPTSASKPSYIVLPSIWLGGSESLARMAADSLGSILPIRRHKTSSKNTYLGQSAYVAYLSERAKLNAGDVGYVPDMQTNLAPHWPELKKQAIKFDLETH